MNVPVLLTAKDIAQSLKISERQAYAMMERRELPVIQIGRLVRVTPEDLTNYIQSRRIEVKLPYVRRTA